MFLLALACAWLDELRDGCALALVSDREIQDHVHYFVDHRLELVTPDIDAIEAPSQGKQSVPYTYGAGLQLLQVIPPWIKSMKRNSKPID